MGENAKKPGKSERNAIDFSIFGKIFQSFGKSLILVPSYGKRKWRQKSKKKPLWKSFREIVENT